MVKIGKIFLACALMVSASGAFGAAITREIVDLLMGDIPTHDTGEAPGFIKGKDSNMLAQKMDYLINEAYTRAWKEYPTALLELADREDLFPELDVIKALGFMVGTGQVTEAVARGALRQYIAMQAKFLEVADPIDAKEAPLRTDVEVEGNFKLGVMLGVQAARNNKMDDKDAAPAAGAGDAMDNKHAAAGPAVGEGPVAGPGEYEGPAAGPAPKVAPPLPPLPAGAKAGAKAGKPALPPLPAKAGAPAASVLTSAEARELAKAFVTSVGNVGGKHDMNPGPSSRIRAKIEDPSTPKLVAEEIAKHYRNYPQALPWLNWIKINK